MTVLKGQFDVESSMSLYPMVMSTSINPIIKKQIEVFNKSVQMETESISGNSLAQETWGSEVLGI